MQFLCVMPSGANLLLEAESHVSAASEAVRLWYGRLPANPAEPSGLATVFATGPDLVRKAILVRYGWKFQVEAAEEG